MDKFFDTLRFELPEEFLKLPFVTLLWNRKSTCSIATAVCGKVVGLSTDEKINEKEINTLIGIFAKAAGKTADHVEFLDDRTVLDPTMLRDDEILQQSVFNIYHSETGMMRYMKNLERRDISLATSMISLGSCTMKLNAAVEMLPITWPELVLSTRLPRCLRRKVISK